MDNNWDGAALYEPGRTDTMLRITDIDVGMMLRRAFKTSRLSFHCFGVRPSMLGSSKTRSSGGPKCVV